MVLPVAAKRPLSVATPAAQSDGRTGKWGGIKSHNPQDPSLGPGHYYLTLEGATHGVSPRPPRHEIFKATFMVNEAAEGSANKAGDRVVTIAITNGSSQDAGRGRVKLMFTALAGYASDDEYDAVDPKGFLIDDTLNGTGCVGRTVEVVAVDSGARTAKGAMICDYRFTPTEGQEPLTVE